MNEAASTAARVAGAVTALAYLTGVVEGPLLGAVGGLALVTFGRALVAQRPNEVLGAAGFALVAAACGVVALRWGTLDLTELRGIQGVLGPTVAVDPATVAVAASAGLGAGIVGLAAWLTDPSRGGPGGGAWWWVEAGSGSLLLVSLFAGPQPTGWPAVVWVGGIALVGGGAIAGGELGRRMGPRARAWVLVVAAVVTAAAAGLIQRAAV